MDDLIRLSRDIHHFVRGELRFEKELELLTEVLESEKWLNHLEMELMLQDVLKRPEFQILNSRLKNDDKYRCKRQSIE